jgi:squalene-associated FAD-dependent desaturase
MSGEATVIVGGGWAGLAAAARLASLGHQPLLLESAKQLGGRARKLAFDEYAVDNGQHLFIGAYHSTLSLLEQVGVDLESAFERQPLQLRMRHLDGQQLEIRAPQLPAPLHLLWALLGASGFSFRSRWRALRFGWRLYTHNLVTSPDQDVLSFLQQAQQTPELIRNFWTPLCIAIMNTPIAQSSAELFVNVLQDAFLHNRQDSDLLYARRDLGSLFIEPAMQYIEQQGGHVQLGQRVSGLRIENDRIRGLTTTQGEIDVRQVILAVPPHAAASLCREQPALTELMQQCQAFHYEPICTVYLQYPETVRLSQPMLGLLGGLGQWVFDRRCCEQPGLLAVVLSSQGEHLQLDNDTLIREVAGELARLFPDWPAYNKAYVVREKRATFASRVDINRIRPDNHSPVHGLWLAGDYTRTGYPATLEGAIRSGLQCAALVHQAILTSEQKAP